MNIIVVKETNEVINLDLVTRATFDPSAKMYRYPDGSLGVTGDYNFDEEGKYRITTPVVELPQITLYGAPMSGEYDPIITRISGDAAQRIWNVLNGCAAWHF